VLAGALLVLVPVVGPCEPWAELNRERGPVGMRLLSGRVRLASLSAAVMAAQWVAAPYDPSPESLSFSPVVGTWEGRVGRRAKQGG
jgi:hypothetical protein